MSLDGWSAEVQRKADAIQKSELGGAAVVPAELASQILDVTNNFPRIVQQLHRDTLLTMAVALADTSEEPSKDAYVRASADGPKALMTALAVPGRDIKDPPLSVLAFRELTMRDATAFWGGVGILDPIGTRQTMIDYRKTMRKMMEELDKHFETLSQSARAVMENENALSQQMTTLLSDGVGRQMDLVSRVANYVDESLPFLKDPAKSLRKTGSEIVAQLSSITIFAKYGEQLKDFADRMSKPGAEYFKAGKECGIPAGDLAKAAPEFQRDVGMYVSDNFQDVLKAKLPDEISTVIQMVGTAADQIEGTAKEYRERRDLFLSFLPNHGTVLVLVSDTRRKVDKFIYENGMDKIRAEFRRICDGLDAWRTRAMPDGLKADADEFAAAVKMALQARMDADQAAFDEFVTGSGRRFIGAVDGPTERILFDPTQVLDKRQRIIDLQLDQKLVIWRKRLIVIEPTLADYQAKFEDAVRGLPEGIRDEMMRRVKDAFGPLRAGLLAATSRAMAAMDSEAAVAGTEVAKADLDITPLRDKMK